MALTFAFLLVSAVVCGAGEPCGPFAPGLPRGGGIASGGSVSLSFSAPADVFVRVEVGQIDADLVVSVFGPDDAEVGSFDGFEWGSEVVAFVTRSAGRYRVEARPLRPQRSVVRFEFIPRACRAVVPGDETSILAVRKSTESKRLAALHTANALRSALSLNREVSGLWHELGEGEAEANTLIKMGDVQHGLGANGEAIDSYRAAIVLATKLGNNRLVAEAENNVGVCAWQLGNTDTALAALRKSLDLWRTLEFRFGEAAACANLGLLAWQTGQFQDALGYHQRARRLFETIGDRHATALTLNNLALTFSSLNNNQNALVSLRRAWIIFRELKDSLAAGRAQINIGYVELVLGNVGAAIRDERSALTSLLDTGDARAIADAETVLARAYSATSRTLKASELLRSALRRYEGINDRRGQAAALHHLGILLMREGHLMDAKNCFERALALRKEAGIRDAVAETIYAMARLDQRNGDLERAAERLDEALTLTEGLRVAVSAEMLRASYLAAKEDYYELYVNVLMQLSMPGKAFDISERSRARTLVDALREGRHEIRKGIDAELRRREESLVRKLAFAVRQQQGLAARPERGQLDDLLLEYELLRGEMRARNGRTAELIVPHAITAREAQNLVDRESVIFEYLLGESRSYVWAITFDEIRAFVLPPRDIIERTTKALIKVLTEPTRTPASEAAVAEATIALRDVVCKRLISRYGSKRRFVIVADGVLESIPFSLLLARWPGDDLGERREVVHMPSVAALSVLRSGAAWTPGGSTCIPVAIIADPVFEADDTRVARMQRRSSIAVGRQLSRLAFSRREAEAISSLVPPGCLFKAVGADATKGLLLSSALRRYKVLHLSTHAWIDTSQAEMSGMALSRFDARGNRVDGDLRLYEVYNLTVAADLVVLSACESALGRNMRGEGVLGLARAFLYAGAGRVVASMWKVDDEATGVLMRAMYESMLGPKRLPPSAALAEAQRVLRTQTRWKDPYFWAGFVFVGDWR